MSDKIKFKKGKIKPKNGWRIGFPPSPPRAPNPPSKMLTGQISLAKYSCNFEGNPLSSLTLPEGVRLEDVSWYVEASSSYDDTSEVLLEFFFNKERPNPNYDQQIFEYQKDLSIYQASKKLFKAELKLYNAWVKQEKQNQLELKLKQAENLLKENGRL